MSNTDDRPDFEDDVDLSAGIAQGWNPPLDYADPLDLENHVETDEEPEDDELDTFPPEIHNDVEGLLFLGALSATFDIYGHQVTMRTLRGNEELAVGQIVDKYEGNISQAMALKMATISAAIVSIDGKPLVRSMSNQDVDTIEAVTTRWNVVKRYYRGIHDMLYDCYSDLQVRAAIVFQELEGKSSAGRGTLKPSSDSLSGKGFSEGT